MFADCFWNIMFITPFYLLAVSSDQHLQQFFEIKHPIAFVWS
uniref:Uncharacterized protein n=1 Tax=Arundo donax TaxID=35708 RepID=A0A0A8Y1Q9_ARUDO